MLDCICQSHLINIFIRLSGAASELMKEKAQSCAMKDSIVYKFKCPDCPPPPRRSIAELGKVTHSQKDSHR